MKTDTQNREAEIEVLNALLAAARFLENNGIPEIAAAAAKECTGLEARLRSITVRARRKPCPAEGWGLAKMNLAALTLGLQWFSDNAATVEARRALLASWDDHVGASDSVRRLLETGSWSVKTPGFLPDKMMNELVAAGRRLDVRVTDLALNLVASGLDSLRGGGGLKVSPRWRAVLASA